MAPPHGTDRALADVAARLKHDLGKYIAFQIRWMGDSADLEAQRAALAADILETRRGPDGSTDAAAVWAGFREVLFGERPLSDDSHHDVSGDVDVQRIDTAMTELIPVAAALRAGTATADDVAKGIEMARTVAEACHGFARRHPTR